MPAAALPPLAGVLVAVPVRDHPLTHRVPLHAVFTPGAADEPGHARLSRKVAEMAVGRSFGSGHALLSTLLSRDSPHRRAPLCHRDAPPRAIAPPHLLVVHCGDRGCVGGGGSGARIGEAARSEGGGRRGGAEVRGDRRGRSAQRDLVGAERGQRGQRARG